MEPTRRRLFSILAGCGTSAVASATGSERIKPTNQDLGSLVKALAEIAATEHVNRMNGQCPVCGAKHETATRETIIFENLYSRPQIIEPEASPAQLTCQNCKVHFEAVLFPAPVDSERERGERLMREWREKEARSMREAEESYRRTMEVCDRLNAAARATRANAQAGELAAWDV